MNDSADMRQNGDFEPDEALRAASNRLRTALDQLERRITPMGRKIGEMERALQDAESFSADRADLAQKLDAASAEARTARQTLEEKERHIAERERQFETLADTTNRQIDAIIDQVSAAIGAA